MLSEWIQGGDLAGAGENKAGITWDDLTHKSLWDPMDCTQGCWENQLPSCKATFYPLWQVMEMKGGSQQLKKGKCCNHLQMMPQGQKVILSLVPGKIMEQVLLEGVSENLREEKVTGNSLHWFTKGRSCLSNFIVFFDKMTRLVDKGRVVICF